MYLYILKFIYFVKYILARIYLLNFHGYSGYNGYNIPQNLYSSHFFVPTPVPENFLAGTPTKKGF